MKKTITEVETAIENRIAELEEEYELDIYDRNDIREEEYRKDGWRHDPFPEELEEEDEEEEDWHYRSMCILPSGADNSKAIKEHIFDKYEAE